MSKTVSFLVFISMFCAVFCDINDCGSVNGEIVSVTVGGCHPPARCILKRGTNATIEISFKTKEDIDELKAVVHGIVLNVPLPFAIPNSNACVDSGIECPMKSGQTYKYVASLPVENEYPKVTVDVKWELRSKDDKDVVCALIPAKVA
ncbi:NPC intracellular cholesterol transporter 2 homolog a-like [Aethina tumida]|uniref:NPC intracellular cholesterol transporter 2 homolog a-like n=1 Tax=Aethina tumida TaxID=116153 RepID=UPI00096AFD6B|nr:NPC intracellular cholesterol transporter 2 homolog a-like [Aethina tumida]